MFLPLSHSIPMAGITQVMTARLEELESMPTEPYTKPKVTSLSYKVTQGSQSLQSRQGSLTRNSSRFRSNLFHLFLLTSDERTLYPILYSGFRNFPKSLVIFQGVKWKEADKFLLQPESASNLTSPNPQSPSWADQYRPPASPATPTCTSRMTTFPRRRLAKCELRSKRRPSIRLSAGTGCATSPKAQLGSRPCL